MNAYRFFSLAIVAALTMPACSAADAGQASDSADIIAGKGASSYPEAVLVNMVEGGSIVAACSGSLIAPKVVLTAGHCVHNFDTWQVIAPHAGGQTAMATHGATYDWKVQGEAVDPTKHDIGLLFLGTSIDLKTYPILAKEPVSSGDRVLNIGRIRSGQISNSSLFVSKPVEIEAGEALGFPYDYAAIDAIESGDSGGPDVLPGAAPHTIVAVNSGANESTEVLARVDLVASWIASQVSSHGGSGGSGKTTKPPKSAACAHDPCAAGARLDPSCDPCVASICAGDGFCCTGKWDAQCASEAADTCEKACATR